MNKLLALVCFAASAAVIACQSESGVDAESQQSNVDSAETVPELGERLDRIGRPEITNMILTDPTKGILDFSALKAEYNVADSFALSAEFRNKFVSATTTAIARMDGYDRSVDMEAGDLAELAGVLVDDYLRVDVTKPCDLEAVQPSGGTGGYFEIERAELTTGKPTWKTCGGHTPNEDSIDTQLTMYARGYRNVDPNDRIHDKVDSSTKKAPSTFPYLADPVAPAPTPPAPAPAPSP